MSGPRGEIIPLAPPRRRVLIVDDHPLVRECLATLIDHQPDLEVCGQAESITDALNAVRSMQPDVLIIDLWLEGGSGLDAIKQLQFLKPRPVALVLSMHDEMTHGERAWRAGARGYVMKASATQHIIEAIRCVLGGGIYFSQALADKLAERYVLGHDASPPAITLLSEQEIQVFRRVGQGRDTRAIAEELHLSAKTVQTYCSRIKLKLGLNNAKELIREAVRWTERQDKSPGVL
jgi:DNA-binding NarL/FixJ family response regulator